MKVETTKLKDHIPSGEFERLLELAEELHEKYDGVRRRLEFYRLCQIAMAIAAAGLVGWRLLFRESLANEEAFLVGALGLVLLLYAGMFEVLRSRMQRRAYPDRNALRSILALVRETEAAVSRAENWSALDRARFQIRLSRLELDPDT